MTFHHWLPLLLHVFSPIEASEEENLGYFSSIFNAPLAENVLQLVSVPDIRYECHLWYMQSEIGGTRFLSQTIKKIMLLLNWIMISLVQLFD